MSPPNLKELEEKFAEFTPIAFNSVESKCLVSFFL